MTATPRVAVYPDLSSLTRGAAEVVVQAAARACAERDRFLWCVSGGRTPRSLYELLATDAFARRIDWTRTELFFGDERCVAPDDPESNYGSLARALLQHVPLEPERVHRIAAERTPTLAAADYESTLVTSLGRLASGAPSRGFDLLLLGLGSDGHTASLFPGSIDEPGSWVSARVSPSVARITLTPSVLNASLSTLFLVSGAEKAERLAEVLDGPADPLRLPAQRIVAAGEVHWFVDRAAATRIAPHRVSELEIAR